MPVHGIQNRAAVYHATLSYRAILAIALSAFIAACSAARPTIAPTQNPTPPSAQPTPQVVGIASWYGPGFDGRPTSTGAIYHQEDLTAASNEFPLGSRVMVTNLDNGRSIEVAVIDRGPFKKGRKIDLSHKAAHIIGMLDKGTAPVRISLISAPPGAPAVGAPLRYFVQVGSFSREDNAERLRDRLTAYYRDVHVDRLEADQRRYYRVRMGAFATRAEAESRARDSARFGLPIIVVPE
ncbi:MAG TPA: septal ring lytic transglycosylase RlpA family protein [Sporolactobacillaceae bacterium]|nr:septal ring lytic transglycosylase RlpA family protein [Sporolactobacillaceae bacterium]